MKIVTVIGARPQFIKASALSREIGKHSDIEEIIVHTGQHFDENMSKVFFEEMEIPQPKYNLAINSLSHGAMTGRMMEEIEKVLFQEKPDWLLVYGDTNSTIAGALAAKKLHIKVAHVEAGLRSFDMKMPEEINRILTDQISDTLFCPSQTAVDNLSFEGFSKREAKIINCGDIMYDSALFYKTKKTRPKDLNIDQEFILATIHRQENTDDEAKLRQIISAFNQLHSTKISVVIPMHPRTRKKLEQYGIIPEFTVIDPVSYLEMVYLLDRCKMVVTDSGGLQKEAYFFNKYCVTIRDTTEWVELIKHGVNELAKVDEMLSLTITNALKNKVNNATPMYGNGDAAAIIVNELKKHLQVR